MGSETDLTSYYVNNSFLSIEYGLSPLEFDELIPWERDFYIVLYEKDLERKAKLIAQTQNSVL